MQELVDLIKKEEPYFENYYSYMENKSKEELIQIIKNTYNYGYNVTLQKEEQLKQDQLYSMEVERMLNEINNGKAIIILLHILKSKYPMGV